VRSKELGVMVSRVEIIMKNDIPSGLGTMVLVDNSNAEEALEKLKDQDFNGRPLRVWLWKTKKGRNSEAGRYYTHEHNRIDLKCTNCGLVGHNSEECSSPPLPTPCHLCAGTDHEPGIDMKLFPCNFHKFDALNILIPYFRYIFLCFVLLNFDIPKVLFAILFDHVRDSFNCNRDFSIYPIYCR